MKRSLGPGTLLMPLPVALVSSYGDILSGEATRPGHNVMTAAWTGIVNSDPPLLSVSLRPSRLTHDHISQSGEFAINVTTRELARDTDFCGVKSGRQVDKFAACGFTPYKLESLEQTCGIAECPLILACRVVERHHYGSHHVFVGKIVDVVADSELFVGERLAMERLSLLSYAHGSYLADGQVIGFFGFSIASEKVLKRRLRRPPVNKK